MSRLSYRLGLIHLLFAVPAVAAGAPPAAVQGKVTTQLFIAPSGEPFRAGPGEPYPIAAWFAAADTNKDGKLTEGEFILDGTKFFDSLDLDHDHQLRGDEIKRYENDIAPEVRSGDYSSIDWNVGGGSRKPARRSALGLMQVQTDDLSAHVPEIWYGRRNNFFGSGGSKYGIIAIPEPITGMDTDLNGVVSRQEMLAAAQRRFRLLDTDEKNFLLLRELPEPYAQGHAGKMRKKR